MSRKPKDFEVLNCKLEKKAYDDLVEICAKSGLTKTAVVERAIKSYYSVFIKTGFTR